MGVTDGHNAGSTVDSGLPNITGNLYGDTYYNGSANYALYWNNDGAFTAAEVVNSNTDVAGYRRYGDKYKHRSHIAFNAFASNSIYGKSSIVQPPAYYVYFWQRTA